MVSISEYIVVIIAASYYNLFSNMRIRSTAIAHLNLNLDLDTTVIFAVGLQFSQCPAGQRQWERLKGYVVNFVSLAFIASNDHFILYKATRHCTVLQMQFRLCVIVTFFYFRCTCRECP